MVVFVLGEQHVWVVFNGIKSRRVDVIVYTGTKLIIGVFVEKASIKCQEIPCVSLWLNVDSWLTANGSAHLRLAVDSYSCLFLH